MNIRIFLCVSLVCSLSTLYAMKHVEKKLETYEALYETIASSDVVSPEIIRAVFNETRALDVQIEKLAQPQQGTIISRAKNIQQKYFAALKDAIRRQLHGSLLMDYDKICKILGATLVSATWAASLSLVYFTLQVQTGNLEQIDQTKLVVAGLEGVVAELVRQGFDQYNTRVGNFAASISRDPVMSLFSATSAMVVHKKTFIARPTTVGMLMAGLKAELLVVFNEVIEKEGGFTRILKNVKIPRLLIGREMVSADQQRLVLQVQPAITSLLQSPKVQQALTQILAVVTESMLVGILTYYAGLGYADEQNFQATLVGSAFRGLVEGSFSYMMQCSGGALVTITGGMFGRSFEKALLKSAGLVITNTDTATLLIEKSMHTAVRYAIDESGGMGNFTKFLVSKTARAINQKWWLPFKDVCLHACDSVLDQMIGASQ